MNTEKKKTHERLLMGLAFGLAASLCALEYGKPLLATYIPPMDMDEGETFITELPPITFPKPPERKVLIAVTPPLVNEFEIVKEIPVDFVNDPVELPEFNFDDEVFFGTGEGSDNPEIELNIPFILVEKRPECPDIQNFLAKNLRYPLKMQDMGIEGIVAVQFVIDKEGNIPDESIKVLRAPHKDLEREVVRVVKLMPACVPGEQRGMKVAVTQTLPIRFFLR